MEKAIRVIKEYDLHELSLVDNPANQFANVLSIEKGELGGILAKTIVDNVYWCKDHDIVRLSKEDGESCPSCSCQMQNIGFVEGQEDIETVKFLVDSAKGIRTIKMTKEDNPMTEETSVVAEAPVADAAEVVENVEVAPEATTEVVAEAEAVAAEAAVEPEVTKSDEVAPSTEEVVEKKEDVVTDIAKNVTDIKDSLTNALSDLAATVKSMQDTVAAITNS
ncbi:MAG: hypothetical protein ACKPKO_52800, partial [Candidatus Fonsibacter sp.]